ncbi:MAG: MGMT family protein [Promethearchaeota archaeon]
MNLRRDISDILDEDFQRLQPFTQEVIRIIRAIPVRKVQTYGGIARMAGNPKGARQVSRILHSLSSKYHLPWHRVINSKGEISLINGWEEQKTALEIEGIIFSSHKKLDLNSYLWEG